MAPTDGAGTDSGSASAPMARRHVIALTIAGAGLAGAVGGLVAFGMANAVTGDRTTLSSSSEHPATTQTVEVAVPREQSLAPSTVTLTPTPTSEASTTPSPAMRGLGAAGSTDDEDSTESDTGADTPDVLPERVLPTLTTTPGADDEDESRGAAAAADEIGAAVRQAGNADDSPSATTTDGEAPAGDGDESPADRDDAGEDGEESGDGERSRDGEPTTTVPTDRDDAEGEGREGDGASAPAPDNALLSDRTPLTAARIDGAFRNALEPGVPADRRDELFAGGADARPLTDRLASLSTGSVPLLHWSVHEPVMRDGDRATVRLRSDVLFNQSWRPVTFVNVDGEWKLTRESTCELSRSLLLPCA